MPRRPNGLIVTSLICLSSLMATPRQASADEVRGEVPPKMLLVSSTTDFYSLRASLGRTGASGTADQPLPANVRMYDIAGGSHVVVPKAPANDAPR